jgi:hypothetical protein
MKGAGTDLDIDRLLDHAAVIGPELLEREDEVLQVHDGESGDPTVDKPVGQPSDAA